MMMSADGDDQADQQHEPADPSTAEPGHENNPDHPQNLIDYFLSLPKILPYSWAIAQLLKNKPNNCCDLLFDGNNKEVSLEPYLETNGLTN